ncbi:MAG TPA: energy transducer TonB [Allosphingosinicella sp.]|jgi:hypothetical protein
MNRFAFAASLLAAAALLPLSAARSAAQEPSGKWVVDYGETYCTASRKYGTADKPVTFALRPSASGKIIRLMIVRRGRVGGPHHIKVNVDHSGVPIKATALQFPSRDPKLEISWINLERQALDGIGKSERIAIRGGGMDEEFALPQIGEVLAALQTCNDDLRQHWNVEGVAGAASIEKHARSAKSLAAYFSDTDYPMQALMEGAGGMSRFTLLVDETGALKDCTVDETSGIASLDAQSCAVLMERAKFTAALDSAGKPVRSVVYSAVRWVSPN